MIYLYIYNEKEKNNLKRLKNQQNLSIKLLEKLLYEQFGKRLSDYKINKGEHGKPFFENSSLHFNISHCDGAVCCAVSKKEIGIDIENANREVLSIAKRVCSENELEDLNRAESKNETLIKYFTLKESYVKYLGIGLSYGLKNAEFSFIEGKPFLKDSELPFYQEKITQNENSFFIAVCGEEVPMEIQIIKII